LVVQPAQNWHGQHLTEGLDGARDRRVRQQGQVRPRLIVEFFLTAKCERGIAATISIDLGQQLPLVSRFDQQAIVPNEDAISANRG
jgi:hypothetical protein